MPKFIRKKDSFLMWHVVHWFVFVFTFGGNRQFRNYWTTIGDRIYYPEKVHGHLEAKYNDPVIAHESHHVEQFKKFGFGNAKVGIFPMSLVYLLFPLPVLISGRYWLERPAYLIGVKERLKQLGDTKILRKRLVDHAVEQLCGPNYGWAGLLWPGRERTRKWFYDNL